MRKSFVVLFLTITLIFQSSSPVHAQFFGLGSTEVTQLLNHAELVSQYIRQGLQLQEALKQTADMIENSEIFTSQVFGPIMSDINALSDIVQGGQALAYSLANLDTQFRNRFRGYAYNPRSYYTDYRNWSQTSLDTTRSTLRAAGLQSQQLQNEQSVMSGVRQMALSAEGRMKALQVANQIAEQEVQQLMKLRELMLVDLQSKEAYQAHEVQKEAATEAAAEQFFRYSHQNSSGNTFQAGWK